MPNDLFIPPYWINDPRLNRRINHDSRSGHYRLDTTGLDVADVTWRMYFPDGTLDQGDVGSCTANSGDEVMASDPYYPTIPVNVQSAVTAGTQQWPLALYHDETVADGFPGTYPPDDTGSDGLTLGKVLTARGLISGFQHTFTAEDALKGLQQYPFSWGTNWKTGMDDVNEDTGEVKYIGQTRGGHQLTSYRIDAANERMWFRNHWGAWGYHKTGTAWISFDGFAQSLADQGDATFMIPLTEPAPTPTPDPGPTPAPTPTPAGPTAQDLAGTLHTWLHRKHPTIGAVAARAYVRAWLDANDITW